MNPQTTEDTAQRLVKMLGTATALPPVALGAVLNRYSDAVRGVTPCDHTNGEP